MTKWIFCPCPPGPCGGRTTPERSGTAKKGNKWKDMDAQSEAAGGIFVNGLLFRA